MTREIQGRSRAASTVCWTVVILSLAIYGSRLRGVFKNVNSFDDAYMFIRYANNLLAGYGVAWNPGEGQVFGVTSLPHLFLVALARWALPLRDSTILSGVSAVTSLGAVLTLVLVSAGASRALRRQPLTWAALILPPLVLQETFTFHALSGMDTMLSVLCNALLIGSVLRYLDGPGWPRMLILLSTAYLTILARPDNGIYATLFPVLAIWLLGPPETRFASLRRFVIGIVAILIADAVAKYGLFGDVLPLGFYAKRLGHYARFAASIDFNPLQRMIPFFTASAPFLVAVVMFARKRDAALLASFLLPVALTVTYYAAVVQLMGMSARFYFPSISFLVVCAALVFDRRYAETGYDLPASGLVVRIVAALALLYVGAAVLDRGARLFAARFIETIDTSQAGLYRSEASEPLPSLGWWPSINAMVKILEDAPAGSSIALSEHGVIGAAGPV